MRLVCIGEPCPQPVINLARAVQRAAIGTEIVIVTDDPAAAIDIPAWARMRGHACELLDTSDARHTHRITVR